MSFSRQHLSRPIRRALAVLMTMAALAGAGAARAADANVRCSVTLSRNPVFVNETFNLVITVEAEGVQLGDDFSLSGLPGEAVLKVGEFRELPVRHERQGGVEKEIRQFRSEAYAPQAVTIPLAPTLQFSVWTRVAGFFGSTWAERSFQSQVAAVPLHVLPLPTVGRPPEFGSAVGEFTLRVDPPPESVVAGELIPLRCRVVGRGHLGTDDAPRLSAVPGLRVYPAKRSEEGDEQVIFEQIVVPETPAVAALPEVSFTFFNPTTSRYETRRAGPFPLRVSPEVRSSEAGQPYRPIQGVPRSPTSAPASIQGEGAPGTGWTGAPVIEGAALSCRIAGILLVASGLFTLPRRLARVRTGHRKMRAALIPTAGWLVAGLGLALAAAGLESERLLWLRGVGITQDVTARLGPSAASAASFEIPAGALVRVREQARGWVKVAEGERIGWVPAGAVAMPAGRPGHDQSARGR